MGNFRSFGNTNPFGMNRGLGNPAFGGVNRANNFNNLNRTAFIANRTNLNINRFSNVSVAGPVGNRGYGYWSGYGGYHRSYGGYGRYGYGRYGYGYPYYGFGYGFGYPFLSGFGLGYGLGLGLFGYPFYGYGYPGYYGLGYGGYGGLGYGGYGGYGAWGYPYDVGYGYSSLGSGYYGPYDWLYGGSLYSYGYSPYSNPYYSYSAVSYSTPVVAGLSYDYSQPIDMVSAPPAGSAADEAAALFNTGRDSFKNGDLAPALRQADAALAKNPNDASLHEFRALCLFALGRYDEAATALYAVLSVGPGWDWPTLINLYPNVNVYTSQLRALEGYVKADPQSASSRLVLAYHYATEGFLDEAADMLKQVVALKPTDTLSAKLLEQIQAAKPKPTGAPAEAPPVTEPVAANTNTAAPEGATISGTWIAEPNAETKVALAIQPGGAFHWQVTQKGQTREFSGTSNFGGGILTLVPDKTPPIVGRVTWTDANHMTFRVVGDSPNAPGLSFAKSVGP
jgi:tetratricopeptide (TPR) repeat protein